MKKACDNCEFFLEKNWSYGLTFYEGRCLFFPPNSDGAYSAVVDKEKWCGQYEPNKEAKALIKKEF